MPPVVPPFLIGLIAAPLAKRLVTPLMKGILKTSVGLAMEVKRAAHEASEGLHDLAAEVTAEVVAAQFADRGAATVRVPAPAGPLDPEPEPEPAAGEGKAHAAGTETKTQTKGRAATDRVR